MKFLAENQRLPGYENVAPSIEQLRLAALEAIYRQTHSTRIQVFDNCEDTFNGSWSLFKRIFSQLRLDGLIETADAATCTVKLTPQGIFTVDPEAEEPIDGEFRRFTPQKMLDPKQYACPACGVAREPGDAPHHGFRCDCWQQ